ncbi:MAG: M15 family metallopeptidase [Steroidobacteraceae bacterium]
MEPRYRFSPQELTGRSRGHIVDLVAPACSLHPAVVEPFLALRAAAAVDGIDLLPVSSFRDFARQLNIWNAKCRGERELRDSEGVVVAAESLEPDALVSTILHWSALPGASRHHWGTDLDVVDAAAIPEGYRPQLVREEFAPGGLFAALDQWLATHAVQFGFYRPYGSYRGGFQPEPWHLSHAPVAEQALQQFSVAMLSQALDEADIEARAALQRCLPQIVERYVMNVDAPPTGVAIRATRPA